MSLDRAAARTSRAVASTYRWARLQLEQVGALLLLLRSEHLDDLDAVDVELGLCFDHVTDLGSVVEQGADQLPFGSARSGHPPGP